MPKFAANLGFLYTELPFLERFGAAARAGFRAVEFASPYGFGAGEVAKAAAVAGVEVILFNLPMGDRAAGDFGMACIAGREAEFRAGVADALRYADALGTKRINCICGKTPPDADPREVRATLIANLRHAGEALGAAGITLMIEPLNTRDVPGIYLSGSPQAADLVRDAGLANMKIQYDCYHMQVMEGDLATKLKLYAPLCGHIQIAGAPERHEPDTGEVRYEYIYQLLDDLKYDGWVGCEYRPAGKTVDGLGWFRRLTAAA
jgi:hydroxypyruvate isomerase